MAGDEDRESEAADRARALGCLLWLGVIAGTALLVFAAIVRATAESGVLGPDAESDPSGQASMFSVVGTIVWTISVGLLLLRAVINHRRSDL